MRGMKTGNEYAAVVGRQIDAPKTVWMAIALSFAMRLNGGAGDNWQAGIDDCADEWQALFDNQIVPQQPRGTRRSK